MNVIVNLVVKNVIHINGGITINVDVSVKKFMYVKKIIFGIFVFVKRKNIQQVLWMIQLLSVIKLQSHTTKIKTIPTNFNERKATCKTQSFYILLAFLLITVALLIAVIYLIKYQLKNL